MRCCWARQNWLLLSKDDATKRERVTFVACSFLPQQLLRTGTKSTIQLTVIAPNGIFCFKDNQRTILVTYITLVHFVWLWACPRYSCVAVRSSASSCGSFIPIFEKTAFKKPNETAPSFLIRSFLMIMMVA